MPGIRLRRLALASTALIAAALPAAARASEDPFEPANRTFYFIHQELDRLIFGHAPPIFRYIPAPIRKGVRNIIANLTEPGVAANDILQGHPEVGAKTLARFAANTTMGVGGLLDVAHDMGIPHHDNGFANTFGRWGAPTGPYIFVTLIGPTDVRDGLGTIADTLTDPFTWSRFYHRWTIIDVRTVWSGIDQRTEQDAQLKAVENMSTDSYATLRSLFLQNRAQEIATVPGQEAAGTGLPTLPDFGDTGGAATTTPAGPAPQPQQNEPLAPLPPTTPSTQGPAAAPSPATPPETKPAASNPHSEVLATNHSSSKLLAYLAMASEPNL